MIELAYVVLLNASIASSGTDCPDDFSSNDYHTANVCAPWLKSKAAYSATFRGSMSPRPAAQQVMIYRSDDAWIMRIAGYHWDRKGAVVTRRREIAISDADAGVIVDHMTAESLDRLSKRPYFGSETVICTDGAQYELAMASGGRKHLAKQHSCAGSTELNETAALLRDLALKYDPSFDGLLSGLDYHVE